VRAVYNKAEYGEQRRVMLQAWADMVDSWIVDGPSPVRPINLSFSSEMRLGLEHQAVSVQPV
jgi:hypothetical protein